MRATAAAATPTLATIGLLLAVGPQAWADSECQAAFERWAKISAARVVPQSSNGRGACVPSEDVRNGLLDGLALAGGICSDASETKTLLTINQSFIASLGVCASSDNADAGSDNADAGTGWGAKSAPIGERPRVAAPLPPPAPPPVAPRAAPPPLPRAAAPPPPPRAVAPAPPPRAAAPSPSPPIAEPPAPPPPAVVAAPPPAPPEPAGPAPTPPCLELSPAQSDSFALVNRRCRGHTVLAVIETPGASGETVCRGYSINYTLAVRAPTRPRVNYECVAGQGPCNQARLGDMFPECDW